MALLGRTCCKLVSDVLQKNKFHKQLYGSINYVTQRLIRSGAYEGDGKTYVTMLNEERERFMINSYDAMGFKLNNGFLAVGPIIIFPNAIIGWNINDLKDVNEASLTLIWLLQPKIDILVLGYGEKSDDTRTTQQALLHMIRKHKIQVEILPTRTAVSTFNFLAAEDRFVAGAMIPPRFGAVRDDVLRESPADF